MTDLRMPSLGADMDRGTLLEWKVQPGDAVHKGDIVAVIDTDKSDIEIESFHDGTVETLLIQPGDEVEVGTPIATLAEVGAPVPAGATAPAVPAVVTAAPVEAPSPAARVPVAVSGDGHAGPGRHHVVRSPLVRRYAEEHHVDVDHVDGTGPGGVVTRADVERAAAAIEARGGRPRSSPLARRLAEARGIDLTAVTGSGPDGAVVAADLDRATPAEPAPPPLTPPPPARSRGPGSLRDTAPRDLPGGGGQVAPIPPAAAAAAARAPARDRTAETRRATAGLMARSKREIPHYYLSTTIDMSRALTWLEETNRDRSVAERILPAALLLKATALAVREVPRLNGWWIEGALQVADSVDLGVGVSLRGGGLIAPAIAAADGRSLPQLMQALREVVARARGGRLRASDIVDPSITVTNLGDQGVEAVHGVIYPPQVAIVGFGAVVERPWAVEGMLTVRPLVTASLAADHRATDGHEGARFLTLLANRLQEPETL